MKIIADSGSTKTTWVLLSPGGTVETLNSIGLNPLFVSSEKVKEIVSQTFTGVDSGIVKEVYFYGAGCSSTERCAIISTGLKQVFPDTRIEVNHDMLAAARALFANKKGIAMIFGTGSNSCVYNGKEITDNIPALGYILGDEGSGAFFGLQLIKDFLNNEMPETLSKQFKEVYHLDKDTIITSVYKAPFPNRYLAHFAPFLSQHINNEYISEMVITGFDLFFKRHVLPYPDYRNYSLGCIGSVGYYLKDILKSVAQKHQLHLTTIEKSPVEGLINFHKKSR